MILFPKLKGQKRGILINKRYAPFFVLLIVASIDYRCQKSYLLHQYPNMQSNLLPLHSHQMHMGQASLPSRQYLFYIYLNLNEKL